MSTTNLNSEMWKTKFDTSLNQVYYENTMDGTITFDLPCEVQSHKSRPKLNIFLKLSSRFCPVSQKASATCDLVADSAVANDSPMRHSSSEASTLVPQSPESFQPLLKAYHPVRPASPQSLSSRSSSASKQTKVDSLAMKREKSASESRSPSSPRSPLSPRMSMLLYFPLLSAKYQQHYVHMDDTNMWPSTLDLSLKLLDGYESDISSDTDSDSVRSFYSELPLNEVYYDEEISVYVDQNVARGDREKERRELRLQILEELY